MAFERQSVGTNAMRECGTSNPAGRLAVRVIGIICIIFLAGNSAFGQFLVNPPTIRETLSPGRPETLATSLNSLMGETQKVDLRLIDLTQGSDGSWEVIEPDDPNADRSNLKSCRSWLTLTKESLTLEPSQMVTLQLEVRVPRGVWGYYFAAIVATPQPREEAALSTMESSFNVNMVIPVVIQVRGRALRCNVALQDLGLSYQRQTADSVPATLVHMKIDNLGTTYSRLQGVTRISRMVGGHWRRLAEVTFPPEGDQGIIPNAKLDLALDVGEPLPRGQYKVEGFLAVDGRRADQIDKEFAFDGDPRAPQDTSAVDAALDLLPLEEIVEAAPGRTRFGSILVANASDEKVTVDVSASLPMQMEAVSLPWTRQGQTVTGPHFDCSKWLSFEPSQFTLEGFGRKSVRIRCDIPESAMPLAQYFAMLTFHARFPDGKDGGTTQGRLYVENGDVEPTVRTRIRQFMVNELQAPTYSVTAQCVNLSDARFMPRCRCAVRKTSDNALEETTVQQFEMVSDVYHHQYGPLLPLEARSFTGILNVAPLEPGAYRIVVQFENSLGGDPEVTQQAVEVVQENGVKRIEERDLAEIGGVIDIRLQ